MNFPESTKLNKRIPKQKFYENLSISAKEKRLFVDEIEAIVWANKLSPDTLPIAASVDVGEIEVIEVRLNQKSVSEAVLRLINKAIPYHLVFCLTYRDECRLVLFYNKFYYSEWTSQERIDLNIHGISTGAIWGNFVRQVLQIEPTEQTLEEQVEQREEHDKLVLEIEKLERMAAKEKQPNKKFELHQKILNLKNNL